MELKIKFDHGWSALRKILRDAGATAPLATKLAAEAESRMIRGEIVEGIREQAPGGKPFLPLRPLTLAARLMKKRGRRGGGTDIMRVTDQLIEGIDVHSLGGNKYFVGVPKNIKRTERGQDLYRIADVQENGKIIIMRRTPKMLRFLMALLRESKLGVRIRVKSKRTGKFIKSRWRPQGARSTDQSAGSSSAVIIVRIPARPYIAPGIARYRKSRAAIEKRVGNALMTKLFGKNTPGVKRR